MNQQQKAPTREQIERIIDEINNWDRIAILSEFLKLNPNKDRIRKETMEKAAKIDDFEEKHRYISESLEKILLHKSKPIADMTKYIEFIYEMLQTRISPFMKETKYTTEEYINEKIKISAHIDFLINMLRTLIVDIQNNECSVIEVHYDNTKKLLMEEFSNMLDTKSQKSPAYKNRSNKREPNLEKLKTYLKVWKLRVLDIGNEDIALILYGDKSKFGTVQKQFESAFELIYGFRYDKEIYKREIIAGDNKKLCDECPDISSCQYLCPRMIAHLNGITAPQMRNLMCDFKYPDGGPQNLDDMLSSELDYKTII